MQLMVDESGDVKIVRVKEPKLTYPNLAPFFAEVRQLVEDGARKVVIDLAAVGYIDSASIGARPSVALHRLHFANTLRDLRRFDDAENTRRMGGYAVANFTADYALGGGWTLFARLTNAFDKHYELAADFNTAGASVLDGVRFQY